MRALRAARTVDPPDWLIGAGAIRDRVWDHLHGFTRPVPVKDLDLAFFDPVSLDGERERSVQRALTAQAPELAWDVTNQAAVHLWYPHVFGVEVDPADLDIGRRRDVARDRHRDRRPTALRRHHPSRRTIRPRRPVRADLPAKPATRDERAIPSARGEQANCQALAPGEDPRRGGLSGGAVARRRACNATPGDARVGPVIGLAAESSVPGDLYLGRRCSVRVWSGEPTGVPRAGARERDEDHNHPPAPRHLGRAWQGRIGSAVFDNSRTTGESSTADGVAVCGFVFDLPFAVAFGDELAGGADTGYGSGRGA